MSIKMKLQNFLRGMGYQVRKVESFEPAMEENFKKIAGQCRGYHLQSIERLYGLYLAVCYVTTAGIEGDIVECGVFKGASLMLAALTLKSFGDTSRKLYLYDTFEGWPQADPRRDQILGASEKDNLNFINHHPVYDGISAGEVRKNLLSTGYPEQNLVFVKGRIEDTIPGTMPDKIALLRIDTDWYGSVKHALLNLYPRLSMNGALIIDDYGHWKGAKDAADEYFREHKIPVLLQRLDYTGRMAVKTAEPA